MLVNRQGDPGFVLQELNTTVFTRPADIAHNLHLLDRFRLEHHPDYLLPLPLPTKEGDPMAFIDGRYYRLTPYVPGSRAYDRCETPEQAYQAARQFGRFTARFNGLQTNMLRYTIPGFHDLPFRWQQFERAMEQGNQERKREASTLVRTIQDQYRIVLDYARIRTDPGFQVRVTHHDTKISNVLFDTEGRGLCVIDLDTVMPGHFISDVGDMMRTYLSPASEEEKDFTKVTVRPDFYQGIREGYMEEMGDQLTDVEKTQFFYAGEFLIYMQAIRFLTDYLENDRYYGRAYEDHNLVRAGNQVALLRAYQSLAETV
jgi:thiamine kinase-like enzyme